MTPLSSSDTQTPKRPNAQTPLSVRASLSELSLFEGLENTTQHGNVFLCHKKAEEGPGIYCFGKSLAQKHFRTVAQLVDLMHAFVICVCECIPDAE